jgi:hypothetical protein
VRRSTRSRKTRNLHWLAALAALVVAAIGAFSPPVLSLLGWPFTIEVALVVGLGAELAAWRGATPARPARLRLRYSAWVLPALLTLAALVGQRLPLDQRATAGLIPGIYLALLALVLVLQDIEAARGAESGAVARFGLTLIGYAVAFGLFTLIFMLRLSAPLSALAGGAGAGLLALVQLRQHGPSGARGRVYATALALTVAQAAAAASFWSTPALVGGALLLLLLYVLAGLAEALLDDGLDRRVLVEYGIVAAFGAGLILSTAPWRG